MEQTCKTCIMGDKISTFGLEKCVSLFKANLISSIKSKQILIKFINWWFHCVSGQKPAHHQVTLVLVESLAPKAIVPSLSEQNHHMPCNNRDEIFGRVLNQLNPYASLFQYVAFSRCYFWAKTVNFTTTRKFSHIDIAGPVLGVFFLKWWELLVFSFMLHSEGATWSDWSNFKA